MTVNSNAQQNPFYLNPNEVMDRIKIHTQKNLPDDWDSDFINRLYMRANGKIRALPISHTESEFDLLKLIMKEITEKIASEELEDHFQNNELYIPRCWKPVYMKEAFNIWTSPLYLASHYFLKEIDAISLTSRSERYKDYANVSENFADIIRQHAESTHLEYLPQIPLMHNFLHAVTNLNYYLNGVGSNVTNEFRTLIAPIIIRDYNILKSNGEIDKVSDSDVHLDQFFEQVLSKGYGFNQDQISHIEQQANAPKF